MAVTEERLMGAAVVAALIRQPSGEVFLVRRGGRWTIPTGHLDPKQEKDLEETLFREMREEIFHGEDSAEMALSISDIVRVMIVGATEEKEGKIITIFLCDVTEEVAKMMSYEEKGETESIWVHSSLDLVEDKVDGLVLDSLAKEAIREHLKKEQPLERKIVLVRKWFWEGLKLILKPSS